MINTITIQDKLLKNIDKIPEYKQDVAKELIEQIIFMKDTLCELQQQVSEEGAVTMFKQGKQEFLRESPAIKVYTTLSQRYNQYLSNLISLFPKDESPLDIDDELEAFIQEGEQL